jgi:hypothetical protein
MNSNPGQSEKIEIKPQRRYFKRIPCSPTISPKLCPIGRNLFENRFSGYAAKRGINTKRNTQQIVAGGFIALSC